MLTSVIRPVFMAAVYTRKFYEKNPADTYLLFLRCKDR